MSARSTRVLVLIAAVLGFTASGCAKHHGVLAPTIKDPVVYDDGFGANVDFQAFSGSKYDAISIDSTEKFSGTTSIKITVPDPGDPSGGYAGGAFTTNRARDLTVYNALTFYARSNRPITFNELGLGNDNTGRSKYTATWANVPIGVTWTKYVIPIPLASRLRDEKGMFFFAEGPEDGAGSTVWFDDIQYEFLTTITNPRPSFTTQALSPDVGADLAVPGTKVTFAVDGIDQEIGAMQGYFTFVSSADTVATGGEGIVRVVGLGSTIITGRLGDIPATGVLTLTPNPAPQSAAPTPTVSAANVISIYSNAYTNVPVDTWYPGYGEPGFVTDVQLAGNDTKRYTGLGWDGVVFGSNAIDATLMTHFHADVWIPQGTFFKIKLVDFGANGMFGGGDDTFHELTFNGSSSPALTVGAWNSFEIPMSAFANLTTRAHLTQLFIEGDCGTAFVDNIYFHK